MINPINQKIVRTINALVPIPTNAIVAALADAAHFLYLESSPAAVIIWIPL